MRWLIIQSDGEHKGQDAYTPNWYLRECYAVQAALENLGHEAICWGLRHPNFEDKIEFESFDVILCLENYDTGWIPDLSNFKSLKIHHVIDLHVRGPKAYDHITDQCDVVLHATSQYIDNYRDRHQKQRHIWFPNAVDARYFDRSRIQRTEHDNDLIFVGSKLRARQGFIDEMVRATQLKQIFATGIDMINLISSAKIHFNRNIGCDINYRTFETIGLGTCLLTDYNDDLYRLGFMDGYNCLMYHEVNEAVAKVKASLKNSSWQAIGDRGYELSKSHTYEKRLETLGREISVRI